MYSLMKSRKKDEVKRNKRWKWMAAATAATAAGATASQASLVTINLSNNYINGLTGNHLNADLTGDGHPDITIASPFTYHNTYFIFRSSKTYTYHALQAAVVVNGISALGFWNQDQGTRGGVIGSYYHSSFVRASIPIFFKDLNINNGAPTQGSLEVTAGFGEIDLDSFTYNSNTPVAGSRVAAVPDQGSSLALLAMGASGILALRRWRANVRS
jgi:hypothetical protein